jgi:hypothetical protein
MFNYGLWSYGTDGRRGAGVLNGTAVNNRGLSVMAIVDRGLSVQARTVIIWELGYVCDGGVGS